MNIKQAKEEIKHTVMAYLSKDEQGEYRIPVIRAATDPFDGTTRHRKDTDHGTDRHGV